MEALLIIYDGACPFCTAYVRLLRLRETFAVELLSARSDDARVSHYLDLGYRLDEGMLVVTGGMVHAGADAMNLLAAFSAPAGWLNRVQRFVFARRWLSRLLYPWLRAGRRAVLWARRVPTIAAARTQR